MIAFGMPTLLSNIHLSEQSSFITQIDIYPIPKEKSRIASSIGDAISKNLMNKEVLGKTLILEEMIARLDRQLMNS